MTDREGRGLVRLLAHAAGLLLAVAALAFVAWRVWQQRLELSELAPGLEAWSPLPLAVLAYTACLLLLVWSWQLLLRFAGARDLTLRLAFLLQARSQIAKYLPGNVFHLAGRHLLGRRAGLGHSTLIGAALHETLGLLTAAAVLSLAGWTWLQGGESAGSAWLPILIVVVGLASPFLLAAARSRLPWLARLGLPETGGPREIVRSLLPVLALYLAFFLGSGLIAATLVHRVDASITPALPIAACTLAWMLGFVTPGAPAGLGVREAVLLGLLGPALGEPAALLLSLQLRIATSGGDLLLFLVSLPLGCVEGDQPAQDSGSDQT